MAVDLMTGEHICLGLRLGRGCENCRKKYPHLIPKSQDEIDANMRGIEAMAAAYTDVLNQGEPITYAIAQDLNRFTYGDDANRFEVLDRHELREAASRTAVTFAATFPTARRLAPVVVAGRPRRTLLTRIGAALKILFS